MNSIEAEEPNINLIQQVKEVKELITDPEHWTTGVPARNRNGLEVTVHQETAYSYCLIGAIAKVSKNNCYMLGRLQEVIRTVSNVQSLSYFNDIQGHAAVLQLLDNTLVRLQYKQKDTKIL